MMIEINLEDLADETRCPVCLGDLESSVDDMLWLSLPDVPLLMASSDL